MDFNHNEIQAMAVVSDLFPESTVSASILLEGGVGYLTLSVLAGTEANPERKHYIVSPLGKMWESRNGRDRGTQIREGVTP